MYVSLSDILPLPVALSTSIRWCQSSIQPLPTGIYISNDIFHDTEVQKPLYYLTPDFAITLEVGEPMKSVAFVVSR